MGQVPVLFQPNDDSAGAVVRVAGTLPEGVPASARAAFAGLVMDQQRWLELAIGFVARSVSQGSPNDATAWANPDRWMAAMRKLPTELYSVGNSDAFFFQERMAGVEFPSAVTRKAVPWASSVDRGFEDCLVDLGRRIRQAAQEGRTVGTYLVVLGYQPVRDGARPWQVASTARCYFASFDRNARSVYSSCGSVERLAIEFGYVGATLSLKAADPSDSGYRDARDAWATRVEAEADDLTKAKAFFTAQAATRPD